MIDTQLHYAIHTQLNQQEACTSIDLKSISYEAFIKRKVRG